jgi:predicted transport protein
MNDLLSLQKLFNETIFRIPDYQRGYSWSNQQLEEFWNDLTSLLPFQEHYTGMISLKKLEPNSIINSVDKWNEEKWLVNSGFTVYEIVDGQQRLTTLIILINEIVLYCKEKNIEELNSTLLSEIVDKYLYKTKPNNIIRTYKFGYEEDNPSYQYFRHVILGEPNNGTIEETFYTLNLYNAKKFFKNRIENYVEQYGIQKLEEIYRKITLQLKFNLYDIKDDFNVYVAFETMNNRGKRLSYLELLKNRLIYLSTLFDNPEDEKKQVRADINDTWREIYGYLGKNKNYPLSDDEFLQNHWMIYFGYQTRKIQGNQTIPYYTYLLNKYFIQQNIDPTNMYVPDLTNLTINTEIEDELEKSEQEENVQDNIIINDKQINLTLVDIKHYVNSLKELIQYWYNMYFPSETYSAEMKKYLFRLKELGHVNARPLITVLLSKTEISEGDKIKCLKYIERFNFLHYRLNGYFSTYDNSVFYNLARDLYYNQITVSDVLDVITKTDYMSDNNVIESSGVVDKFRKLFKRDGYYSWGTLKYLLYVYDINNTSTPSEQKLNPSDYFKQDPKDSYSVEHIYPQKAVNEYWEKRFNMYSEKERKLLSSSLGNMLPLSKRINSKLQNNSFVDKKNRYMIGSRSEQKVAQYEEWTPETILNRGLEILTFIENEWEFKFPNLAEKKKILGLEFMINDNDIETDVYIPEYKEEDKTQREVFYDEEQFKKLSNNTNERLLNIFNELDNYILSLNENIKKNTTSVYLSYSYGKNFIELWFQVNSLKYVIMTGDYDDPKGLVVELAESYKWTNDRCIFVNLDSDIEYIKYILKQSFEKQLNR